MIISSPRFKGDLTNELYRLPAVAFCLLYSYCLGGTSLQLICNSFPFKYSNAYSCTFLVKPFGYFDSIYHGGCVSSSRQQLPTLYHMHLNIVGVMLARIGELDLFS